MPKVGKTHFPIHKSWENGCGQRPKGSGAEGAEEESHPEKGPSGQQKHALKHS